MIGRIKTIRPALRPAPAEGTKPLGPAASDEEPYDPRTLAQLVVTRIYGDTEGENVMAKAQLFLIVVKLLDAAYTAGRNGRARIDP